MAAMSDLNNAIILEKATLHQNFDHPNTGLKITNPISHYRRWGP